MSNQYSPQLGESRHCRLAASTSCARRRPRRDRTLLTLSIRTKCAHDFAVYALTFLSLGLAIQMNDPLFGETRSSTHCFRLASIGLTLCRCTRYMIYSCCSLAILLWVQRV